MLEGSKGPIATPLVYKTRETQIKFQRMTISRKSQRLHYARTARRKGTYLKRNLRLTYPSSVEKLLVAHT